MDQEERAQRRRFEDLMERSEALRRQFEALAVTAAGLKMEVELLRKKMALARRDLEEFVNRGT
jgi:hypothetical protein